jgi:hypothetical protein
MIFYCVNLPAHRAGHLHNRKMPRIFQKAAIDGFRAKWVQPISRFENLGGQAPCTPQKRRAIHPRPSGRGSLPRFLEFNKF